MIRAEQLHARIMDELDMTREIEDEELTRLIYQVLNEASKEEHLSLEERRLLAGNYLMPSVSWIFCRIFWKMKTSRRS